MKYYLVILLTNTQGQDASSIEFCSDIEKAQVAYHQKLSAYHNADDVLFAVVKILNEYGVDEDRFYEVVDHRPQPEPEV